MYLHMYLFAGDIVSGIRRLELAFLSCCVHIWAEQTKIEWCGFCHGLSCLKDQKNPPKKYQVASRIPQGVLGFECGKILKRNKEIYKTSRLLGYSLLKSWPYDHHFKQNAANSCKFFKTNWLRPLMLFTVKLAGWRMATSAPTWDVLYPTVFWRIRNTHCPHCRTKQEKTSNSNQTVALRSRWCQIRSVHGVNQNIGPSFARPLWKTRWPAPGCQEYDTLEYPSLSHGTLPPDKFLDIFFVVTSSSIWRIEYLHDLERPR